MPLARSLALSLMTALGLALSCDNDDGREGDDDGTGGSFPMGGSAGTAQGGGTAGGDDGGEAGRGDGGMDATGGESGGTAGNAGASGSTTGGAGAGGASSGGSSVGGAGTGGAGMGGGGAGGAGGGGMSGAGSGGMGPTCSGAGICGRAPDGIYCARSNGSSALTSYTRWSADFSDAQGWTPTHFWATIQYTDLNGDGRSDICGRAASGITCALSTNAGAFTALTLWLPEFSDVQGWHVIPGYWATVQFADVNGDDFADVCGRAPNGIICALSNGVNAFAPSTVWSTEYTDVGAWNTQQSYWGTIQFPDVNGDGRADVCGRSSGGTMCALSNGTTFGTPILWETTLSDAQGMNSSPSYWKTIQFPDLNGDGAADLCARNGDGVICAISNGVNAFGALGSWAATFSNANGWNQSQAYWGTIQFPDVNGDGKADVCGRANAGVYCGLSSGTSFGAVGPWATAFSDAAGYLADSTRYATIQYPDLDADGRADICGRATSGMICGLSTGSAFTTSSWTDRFGDADGWQNHAMYSHTIQATNLNVPGCTRVTKPLPYQTIVRRLSPF